MLFEFIENFVKGSEPSLNPYSNGICSLSADALSFNDESVVLILILMEYAL